jgi:hypothetical protein
LAIVDCRLSIEKELRESAIMHRQSWWDCRLSIGERLWRIAWLSIGKRKTPSRIVATAPFQSTIGNRQSAIIVPAG